MLDVVAACPIHKELRLLEDLSDAAHVGRRVGFVVKGNQAIQTSIDTYIIGIPMGGSKRDGYVRFPVVFEIEFDISFSQSEKNAGPKL